MSSKFNKSHDGKWIVWGAVPVAGLCTTAAHATPYWCARRDVDRCCDCGLSGVWIRLLHADCRKERKQRTGQGGRWRGAALASVRRRTEATNGSVQGQGDCPREVRIGCQGRSRLRQVHEWVLRQRVHKKCPTGASKAVVYTAGYESRFAQRGDVCVPSDVAFHQQRHSVGMRVERRHRRGL